MDIFDGEDREHQSRVIFGGPVDDFVAFGHVFLMGWMGCGWVVMGWWWGW